MFEKLDTIVKRPRNLDFILKAVEMRLVSMHEAPTTIYGMQMEVIKLLFLAIVYASLLDARWEVILFS